MSPSGPRLADLLGCWRRRIQELDQAGQLLRGAPELLRLMGDARSELFHYEVRSTYDTPEVADSRRIVEEAQRQDLFHPTNRRTTSHGGDADGMKRFYAILAVVAVARARRCSAICSPGPTV